MKKEEDLPKVPILVSRPEDRTVAPELISPPTERTVLATGSTPPPKAGRTIAGLGLQENVVRRPPMVGKVPTVSKPSDRTQIATDSQPPALPPTPTPSGTPTAPIAVVKTAILQQSDSNGSQPGFAGSGLLQVGPPRPGMRIGQYELIKMIGEGGMGTVFLARDMKLGRRVAIKFLQTTHPELTRRFLIEARATARCSHENIVIIYEVGEWGGNPFMVLEFLKGEPLNDAVKAGQKLPIPRVVEIMTPVLRALACAHEQGIAHRDLKPENCFVTESGTIKVLDFGIAKVLEETHGAPGAHASNMDVGMFPAEAVQQRPPSAEELGMDDGRNITRRGAIMGTLAYMSPEQWGIGVEIDHRTDIWAVGIMMYMMLTGHHPLEPLVGNQLVITAMLDQPMPSLAEKGPDMPKELVEIVDKCLRKKKEERYPDALSLLRALEPFQPGRYRGSATREVKLEESPYAGLSSFQEEDAGRFFGRAREIAAMGQRLRDRPIMAVVGPSGVGKSSFVRAGLVPSLKNSGEAWDILVIRPGRSPMGALASLLNAMVGTSNTVQDDLAEQQKLAERLMREPGYLGTALRARARKEKKNLLLFVDQFEELYTLVQDQKERLAFTGCLSGAADDATSPMRVVVSIRSDFLDRCVEDSHFMNELSQGLFFMQSPSREGMRDALVQPAEMAGYKFESDSVVEEMLDHLATTSGALPLLQFTASKLWEQRDPSRRMLTEAGYRSLGGIGGALASHSERVLEKLSNESRTMARGLFLRLVTSERTRAIVSIDELREQLGNASAVQKLIDHLVQARLLVVNSGGGGSGATVEIVHESLIHRWPTLARWLDESHEDTVFLEQLRNAARQWATKGKDSGLLWRGEMGEEAKRFLRRYRGELPEQQKSFLKAVVDLGTRASRVRRFAVVSSVVFLLGLLAAAAVALVIIMKSRVEAKRQAEVATAAEKQARHAEKDAKASETKAEDAEAEAVKDRDDVQRKEAEREAADEAEQAARADADKANLQVKESADKLAKKNADLERINSEIVQEKKAADQARAETVQANAQLKVLLDEAKKRAALAEQQLHGGAVIDTLN